MILDKTKCKNKDWKLKAMQKIILTDKEYTFCLEKKNVFDLPELWLL